MDQKSARDLADRIVDYLLTDVTNEATSEFLAAEYGGLAFVRDPWPRDLPTEHLKELLQFWQGLPRIDGIPNIVEIDPAAVGKGQDYLMLIDIDDEHDDFRYALYSPNIARVAGVDMTGKSVWQLTTTSHNQVFFAAGYTAARRLKRPIYILHEAQSFGEECHWHRLILPLGVDGVMRRLLVCNLPIRGGAVL